MRYINTGTVGANYNGGLHLLNGDVRALDKIEYKKQRTARKSHTCEMCGCEIHKGEAIWWYKPKPDYIKVRGNRKGKKTYNEWRKRCGEHEPKSYAELEQIKAMESRCIYE